MKIDDLKLISAAIAKRDPDLAIQIIGELLTTETGPDWNRHLNKLANTLRDGTPRFSVLAKDGNSKEPFLSYSSLPGLGFCPGMGACGDYCYSFRSHRYPAAYARQAQNSYLMQSPAGRQHVRAAFQQFNKGAPVDFRLYVDGDFGSVGDVSFWFGLLRDNPWLRAYGYSKSFRELLAYPGEFPSNYMLNLSNGHKHSAAILAKVKRLPIARGEFLAVQVGYKVTREHHGDKAHNANLRKAYGSKAFTCPGKCGSCTPTGHACGSEKFRGVDIIIAVH